MPASRLDGLVSSSSVFAPSDQVHDEDDDDESCECGADGNRNNVVRDLVLLANLSLAELVAATGHERLNFQIDDVCCQVSLSHFLGCDALEGVVFVSMNAENSVFVFRVHRNLVLTGRQSHVAQVPEVVRVAEGE